MSHLPLPLRTYALIFIAWSLVHFFTKIGTPEPCDGYLQNDRGGSWRLCEIWISIYYVMISRGETFEFLRLSPFQKSDRYKKRAIDYSGPVAGRVMEGRLFSEIMVLGNATAPDASIWPATGPFWTRCLEAQIIVPNFLDQDSSMSKRRLRKQRYHY